MITPSPAKLRAGLAEARLPIFRAASQLVPPVHPTRLGKMLNEQVPMPPEIAQGLARVIEGQESR